MCVCVGGGDLDGEGAQRKGKCASYVYWLRAQLVVSIRSTVWLVQPFIEKNRMGGT